MQEERGKRKEEEKKGKEGEYEGERHRGRRLSLRS
jgi:hypothetical protein